MGHWVVVASEGGGGGGGIPKYLPLAVEPPASLQEKTQWYSTAVYSGCAYFEGPLCW